MTLRATLLPAPRAVVAAGSPIASSNHGRQYGSVAPANLMTREHVTCS